MQKIVFYPSGHTMAPEKKIPPSFRAPRPRGGSQSTPTSGKEKQQRGQQSHESKKYPNQKEPLPYQPHQRSRNPGRGRRAKPKVKETTEKNQNQPVSQMTKTVSRTGKHTIEPNDQLIFHTPRKILKPVSKSKTPSRLQNPPNQHTQATARTTKKSWQKYSLLQPQHNSATAHTTTWPKSRPGTPKRHGPPRRQGGGRHRHDTCQYNALPPPPPKKGAQTGLQIRDPDNPRK